MSDNMKQWSVGILGARGYVGKEFIEVVLPKESVPFICKTLVPKLEQLKLD